MYSITYKFKELCYQKQNAPKIEEFYCNNIQKYEENIHELVTEQSGA